MDLKEHGNELFQAGKFQDACTVYADALSKMDRDEKNGAGEADKAMKVALLSNKAMCHLKLEQLDLCVRDCSLALELEPTNVKVLYRRAKANADLKNLDPAARDLRLLLDLDKKNNAAMQLMKELKAKAADMSSTTTQTMDVLDAALAAPSETERTSKLRMILGSIMDDQHLAKSIVQKGACEKLWSAHAQDSLALKILSKLSEFDGCYDYVLKVVNVETLTVLVGSSEDEDSSAAALHILWRLVGHEDVKKETDAAYVSTVNADSVISAVILGLRSDSDAVRRVAVEGSVRLCADKQDRATYFVENDGMGALMTMIEREYDRNEPLQQVSVVLGQILPTLKNDDLIKRHALAFCKELLFSDEPRERIKGVAGLDAICFANRDLGQAMVKEDDLLDRLRFIARFGTDRAQALTAEVFSHLANTEEGRAMLAGEPTETLQLLATSDSPQVRSAAAVCLAKLNALDFNAESENGMLVLSSVMTLLRDDATKEEHAKGVEAVSFVINDSQVKMMFIKGEGLKVLKELVKLGKQCAGEPYAYGLAFILENFTTSLDDKRREKLREMEVTEEQWEQFEKLTKSQSRKPGQEDPRENVEIRIKILVEVEGISALRALILSSNSERVWEAAARSLCQIATVQSARRQMIAQGALRALFKLTSEGSDVTKRFAAHTIAKIFVTTDPHVLKDEQLMDAIGPLVRQVRHSDEDLVVFECCMALTNIATVSFEAKQKMVNAKAIQAFEYAQYSENLMVRRAATESLNNLIPTEELIEWICKPDKLRLWLLFAVAHEEDEQTACAATGALANLAVDERVAKALSEQEDCAVAKLVELASCNNINLVHRAVVCLLQLIESWPEGKGRQVLKEEGAETALKRVLKTFTNSPAAAAAQECLDELAKSA